MLIKKNFPFITICIPVFQSEKYLSRCLESVFSQNYQDFEVIVVNDNSNGFDDYGNNFAKIIKSIEKKFHKKIKTIVHEKNKGLLEARRTAVYAAKGKYICILDSDDFLEPNALFSLSKIAEQTNADVIHGKTYLFFEENTNEFSDDKKKLMEIKEKVVNHVFDGILQSNQIFDGFLLSHNHCGFLWAKLIKSEIYIEALSKIPPINCTMNEDFLQYFFISYFAKKYIGFDEKIYNYSLSSGISSRTKITDLEKWEKICSSSSIFVFLLDEIQNENPQNYSLLHSDAVKIECIKRLKNNLLQYKSVVSPEIQKEAYEMLCDYWGEDFVKQIEKSVSEQ